MNPHFIVSILDENMDYDNSTGKITLPFSSIYYEFIPKEDDTVSYQVGVMDNSIEGTLHKEGGSIPENLDPKDVPLIDLVTPVAETISNNFPDNTVVHCLMGYEPEGDMEGNLYNLSAEVAEEIVHDFYDQIKSQKEKDDSTINYDRVLSWMEEVKDKGVKNTPRTLTAMIANKDGSSAVSIPPVLPAFTRSSLEISDLNDNAEQSHNV